MKKITLATTLIVATVGIGTIIGCGGSSSGGAKGTGYSQAPLDTRSVETIGGNIADLVPGCVFTGNSVSTVLDTRTVRGYGIVYDSIAASKNGRQSRVASGQNQSMPGSCGGTLTTSGSESNVHYSFDHYCTGDATFKTTVNGSVDLQVSKNTNGEITSAKVSTGSSGLSSTTVDNSQTSTEQFYLNDLEYKVGTPNRLTLKELKIDSTTEGTYRLTDVAVNQYGEADNNGTVEVEKATYYDPDIGAVTLSTSRLPMSDTATGPGWFKLTRGGKTATFTTDDVSSGKFDVEQDGKKLGALDCSATLTQIK